MAEGIIENSFPELEPVTFKLLLKEEPGRPPVYPVGPLVNEDGGQTGVDKVEQCLCLKCWTRSRVAVSYLSVLVPVGCEEAEPNEEIANGSYFTAEPDTHVDPFDFLPKGIVERTEGRGLVVPSWAPQAQVLSHACTGGFLTHCGWNSVLESVVNGVPLVAWPLYAEQRMNAVLVTEGVNVALRPMVGENGLVEREEIASVVKNLMEGEDGKKLLHRMKELKETAATALMDNRSSTKQISQLARQWKGQTATSD
ncbi:Hydroquinone glucosyltransferase [Spatholobus suberectus]|nr:Hydroquinone glucosyltransferase [Spatholobus suberectus]